MTAAPGRYAVVGGGIAGLAAAWELTSGPAGTGRTGAPAGVEVTVFEASRIGGRILTAELDGRPLDCGADSFLTRVPDASRLAEEAGIAGELIEPAAGRALIWSRGTLRELPEGLVLGIPARARPLLSARLLSGRGTLRAAADLALPAERPTGDVAVGELVGRRLGREVVERLVDPLVGGIHAGSADELSSELVAPQILEAARDSRSLILGLRKARRQAGSGPSFVAPRSGMGRLSARLAEVLSERGVRFVLERVRSLEPAAGGVVAIEPGGLFDGAVVALGPGESAPVLAACVPSCAEGLRSIRSASVAVVALSYRADALPQPAGASGFLVPRGEGRLLTACSFASAKWPEWAAPGTRLLRASVGRDGDRRFEQLSDEELVERLHAELESLLHVAEAPRSWLVTRWPASFPQYEVGHRSRVAAIRAALEATLPAVSLAGAGYEGTGIPACVASGRAAASRLVRPSA